MPKVETFNKELVISQATKVFHEKGFNATSMQDLVNATGLNRSSIYNTFESKNNLFLECLNAYQEENKQVISKLLLSYSSPLEAVNAIFESYLQDILKSKKDKGCLIINCKSELAFQNTSITSFLSDNQDAMLKLFEGLIDRGQKQGLINTNKDGKEYALYLYSSLQGFRMTGILLNDKKQLRSILNTTLQILN